MLLPDRAGVGEGLEKWLLYSSKASANSPSALLATHPILRLCSPFPRGFPWPGHQQGLTIPASQSTFLWGVFVAPRVWEVSPGAGFGLKKTGTSNCRGGGICSGLTPSWVGWKETRLGAIKLGKVLVKKIPAGRRKNVRSLRQVENCPVEAQIYLKHQKDGKGGDKP